MNSKSSKTSLTALLGTVAFAAFAVTAAPVIGAQKSQSDGSNSQTIAVEGTIKLADSHGNQGGQGQGGQGHGQQGQGAGNMDNERGGGSLRDIFRDMVDEADEERRGGGRQSGQGAGGQGGAVDTHEAADDGGDEDSDRPEWAGTQGSEGKPGQPNPNPGDMRGDLYGDMYVLLRDENGVPILTAEGFVQPLDENGVPIPLDEEGHPIDETLTVEVEMGRLNVGRSPLRVLSARYEEAISVLNDADSIAVDPAGRIEYTIDGVTKAIDSPLENLALYVELVNTGTLTGIVDTSKFTGDLAVLVDGQLTADDFAIAANMLAASADKTGTVTIDSVIYINSILDVAGTLPDPTGGDLTYVDYSTFSYDRSDVYAGVTADVLVLDPDTGNWVPTTVNIYDAVFASVDYASTSGVDGFAQATDDARAVIEYIHEYALPEVTLN